MIRSRHWHRSAAWPTSYWRERIERLRQAPAAAPVHQAQLLELLDELGQIAAQLGSFAGQGEVLYSGARRVPASVDNAH
jgi:hypothetical protein